MESSAKQYAFLPQKTYFISRKTIRYGECALNHPKQKKKEQKSSE